MSDYIDRAKDALTNFNTALKRFDDAVAATAPDPPKLPRKALDDLRKLAARSGEGSSAIARSLNLIDVTALDIVDMQMRLQGETGRLASALRELGDLVEGQHFIAEAYSDELVLVRETAAIVAARLFPGAVEGLRDVNVKLWDFERLLWLRFSDTLAAMAREGNVSADQQSRIQAIADEIRSAFEAINALLNELAEGRAEDARRLRARLDQAPRELTRTLDKASKALDQKNAAALSDFRPLVRDAAKIGDAVAKSLRKLSIPIFPAHEKLVACCDLITADFYNSLSGAQAFALLNILARMQATKVNGAAILDGRHATVTHVFPDRIYLEIDKSLIDDLVAESGRPKGSFTPAPAGLHRFKDGSFKQVTFRKGNLQMSYAADPPARVKVDADIDLFKDTAAHLFGEVLVNHLTGSTTDQFRVREILDEQNIAAIADFELLEG